MVLPVEVWERVKAAEVGSNIAELRGWARERVGPRYRYMPTVYEVCSPCPTHRDVYLRRVVGYRVEPSRAMACGAALHDAFLEPLRHLSEIERSLGSAVEALGRLKCRVLRRVPRDLRRAASALFDVGSALALKWAVDERKLPVLVEPYVEASSIGMADGVRPDLVVGLIPVDFVVSQGNGLYLERKRLAVTAYGMAIESMTGNPVDYGVVAVVRLERLPRVGWRVVQLTDELRSRVLEERDEVARIAEHGEDPGLPPSCPRSCPWRSVCREDALHM